MDKKYYPNIFSASFKSSNYKYTQYNDIYKALEKFESFMMKIVATMLVSTKKKRNLNMKEEADFPPRTLFISFRNLSDVTLLYTQLYPLTGYPIRTKLKMQTIPK